MSGIEIAGLVLAALPLVISALENYETFTESTIIFLRFKGELNRSIRSFRVQYTSFEQTIEVLLGMIVNDEQRHEMINNSASKLWKDEAVEKAMRESLGKTYGPYKEIIEEIQIIMLNMASELKNLDGSEHVKQHGLQLVINRYNPAKENGRLQKFQFRKRVQFTMKRKGLKQSLGELQNWIEMLDKFQSKASQIKHTQDVYKKDNHRKFFVPLSTIRNNAQKLHSSLTKTWCSSHSSHSAGLLLEQRRIRKSKRVKAIERRWPGDQSDKDCFYVSLLQSSTSVSEQWKDVEVRIAEFPLPQGSSKYAQYSQQRPNYDMLTDSSSSIRITISVPPSTSDTAADILTPYHDPSSLEIVTDLCATIQSPSYSDIGFCLDSDGHLRGAYSVGHALSRTTHGVSLQDLFKKTAGDMNHIERYTLSITLVSSLLQLGSTPLLEIGWNKGDILFLRGSGKGSSSGPLVDLVHPYLVRKQAKDANLSQPPRLEPNACSTILALGVMLLEICYSVSIESLVQPQELGPEDTCTEYSYLLATRRCLLAKEESGKLSYAFSSAIQYCIECFMKPNASLSDPDFVRTVEDKVLTPLESELHMLLFGPAQDEVLRTRDL